MPASAARELRQHVQTFARRFGLLSDDRTPCGQPVTTRDAHALMLILGYERQHRAIIQKDLAAELGIDKSNVTRLVQSLATAGRVERITSNADGRARLLRLTTKGRRLAESIEAASHRRFERLLAAIAPAQRQAVISAFTHLNDAVARNDLELSHAASH